MLFAIGAGSRVIGVSSYDHYPPEVALRQKVGALLDPDLERILALRPDLVVVYGSQDDLRRKLQRASVGVFDYRHGGLAHVGETMRALGARVGLTADADRAAAGLERALADIGRRVAGQPRPRVLIVIDREPGSLRQVLASGGLGFLHDLVTLAGGDNMFADVARESVHASSEAILARAPDVILELRPGASGATGIPSIGAGAGADTTAWRVLGAVPAVRTGRVVALVGDEFLVAGPRVAQAAQGIARVLHPGRV
jgi:iron complex transport system substrate-binding protein